MIRYYGLLLLVVAVASGCTREDRLETRPLPNRNPTSWEFDLPVETLRARVVAALEQQVDQPIFGRVAGWPGGPTTLSVSEAGSALFGADVLGRPGNGRDLYLHTFHSPLWESPVYRTKAGGVPFLAEFHLHLSAINAKRTRIVVTALRAEVRHGEEFGIGHNGLGWFSRYVPVEPTSIEEYTILRYIGGVLGERSMPTVILPAA